MTLAASARSPGGTRDAHPRQNERDGDAGGRGMEHKQGTITRLQANDGYGFITTANGDEYFFHRNATKGAPWGEFAVGTPVDFDVEERGPGDDVMEHARAVDVRLAAGAPPAVDNELLPPEKTMGSTEA